jgi:hypothetical protein
VSRKSSTKITSVGGQCYVRLQLYWHSRATNEPPSRRSGRHRPQATAQQHAVTRARSLLVARWRAEAAESTTLHEEPARPRTKTRGARVQMIRARSGPKTWLMGRGLIPEIGHTEQRRIPLVQPWGASREGPVSLRSAGLWAVAQCLGPSPAELGLLTSPRAESAGVRLVDTYYDAATMCRLSCLESFYC